MARMPSKQVTHSSRLHSRRTAVLVDDHGTEEWDHSSHPRTHFGNSNRRDSVSETILARQNPDSISRTLSPSKNPVTPEEIHGQANSQPLHARKCRRVRKIY